MRDCLVRHPYEKGLPLQMVLESEAASRWQESRSGVAKILTIIYSILKNESGSYDEGLYQVLQDRLLKHRQDKMIKELANSGFVITPPARTA